MESYTKYKTKRKIATFIDSENVNKLEVIPELLKYLDHEGFIPSPKKIIVSKITQPEEYTRLIKEYCLELVVSYKRIKKGKAKKTKEVNHNNADFRYYIEVLDCFYKENDIDAFCIVTSDDDYTELILKLKNEGKFLIGVGNKDNTSPKFRALFDEFLLVEDLLVQNKVISQNEETTKAESTSMKINEEENVNKEKVHSEQKADNYRKYVYTETDKDYYENVGFKNRIYKMTMTPVKELNIAGKKETVNAFLEIYNVKLSELNKNKLFKYDLDNTDDLANISYEIIQKFGSRSMDLMGNEKLTSDIIENLSKKGYDGMVDVNDIYVYNGNGKNPLILFNPKDSIDITDISKR